jgi:hypothetical protein
VDLVSGKGDKAVGARLTERREVAGPALAQPCEPLDVKGDNMGHARLIDRHVGPVGMAGDGDEVELQCRSCQRVLETAVAVAQVTMVVNIAPQLHEA